jgi:hypothetical protein
VVVGAVPVVAEGGLPKQPFKKTELAADTPAVTINLRRVNLEKSDIKPPFNASATRTLEITWIEIVKKYGATVSDQTTGSTREPLSVSRAGYEP